MSSDAISEFASPSNAKCNKQLIDKL